ncbi:hypothetical protein [Dyadobacter diqingensis]|uniref:hypothetical protein n=1 Tax=Dyadobacter diqingensis TaxID=2938121 RepID=UPI0020C3181A|nr:hypothetical protein [Dyadobacter diqingensis]
MPAGVPLTQAQYQTAFAQLCENIANYNRLAADAANRLWDYPENIAIPEQVNQVLHYDDLYRMELARRKYLQENRMLPADEPQREFRKPDYKVPTSGLELGTALRNLSKNVSIWKKRLNDQRYPDADQKHAMYVALYNEAKSNADAERARQQSLANESRNNN